MRLVPPPLLFHRNKENHFLSLLQYSIPYMPEYRQYLSANLVIYKHFSVEMTLY